MILQLLSLIASLSFAQNQQLPTANLQAPQAQQAVQNTLNQKFNVSGGTLTGSVIMSTTTFPLGFICTNVSGNCINFTDGSGQNTGNIGTLSGNNTWTGTNIFTTTPTFQGQIQLGDNGQVLSPAILIPIKSNDGASQSAGCLVVVTANASGLLIFSSTTTSSQNGKLAVLQQTCAPGAICQVQTYGLATITETGATTLGDNVITTSTRCQGSQSGALAINLQNMMILRAIGGSGAVQVWID